MKKLFTALLTLVFVLSLGAVAFASTSSPVLEDFTLNGTLIPKSFEPIPDGKLAPAETFTFSFTQQAKTVDTNLNRNPDLNPDPNIIVIDNTMIDYTAGVYGDKTGAIDLDAFDSPAVPVGRYTFDVEEVRPTPLTAGMVYTERTGTLFVDKESDGIVKSYLIIGEVGNDKDKKYMNFDNKFEAGDLIITKEVTGNLGDKTKLFDVEVTLTAPVGKVVKDDVIALWKGMDKIEDVEFIGGIATVTFEVKDGDTFTIKNLPYGVTYTVEEADPMEGYTVKTNGELGRTATGTIGATNTVDFVNDKFSEIPTGISLDSLPYILILVLATSGMGVLFFKRRHAF